MTYTTVEARQQLLARLAAATEQLGVALAHLGEAYELLDEHAGEQLEAELFRPLVKASGLAKRCFTEFAARHGLPDGIVEPDRPRPAPGPAKGEIALAVDAITEADNLLAALQDSMLPVEVGDPELREALSQVRRLIAGLPEQARRLVSVLGR
jgi:hypothetical protein